jgi:hypothetical protein
MDMNQLSKDIIIETDLQTAAQDSGDTPIPYPYDPAKIALDIPQEPFSIYEYLRLYKRGRLKIDPDFQRNSVWKPEQKSRFIESILLNFPLPPLYVNQQKDNSLVIIDGLQRTMALKSFLDKENGTILTGLLLLPDLNGLKFTELPSHYQAIIESRKLWIYILKPSTPIQIIYELFDRINTGGTPLNRQEVRNGIFTGKGADFLKKLSEQPYFRKAIDNGVSPTRMKDRELILRYLAFQLFDYQRDYEGNMSVFVEKAMKMLNLMDENVLDQLEQNFKRVMGITFDFFENRNFRVPIFNSNGVQKSRGSIHNAVFESVTSFFATQQTEFLMIHKKQIQENFNKLLQNKSYLEAVETATNRKAKVILRFELAKTILSNL